jgi:hypothetical protein
LLIGGGNSHLGLLISHGPPKLTSQVIVEDEHKPNPIYMHYDLDLLKQIIISRVHVGKHIKHKTKSKLILNNILYTTRQIKSTILKS